MFYERYGGPQVLELRDLPRPVPGNTDVLVRVEAASLNRSDWENLVGSPAYARLANGLRRPRRPIPGSDFAGEVVAKGGSVTRFAVGDRVFGDLLYHGASTFAEFVRFPESATVTTVPTGLSFAQAATLPQAGTIALQGMQDVHTGMRVLVIGGGGATGLFAIQLASAAGGIVTATDSAAKLETMRSLGAASAFDYRTDELADSGQTFDLILDPVAGLSPATALRLLNKGGRYRVVGGPLRSLLAAALLGLVYRPGGKRLGVLVVKPGIEALDRLGQLAASGRLRVPIERELPLEDLPEALRRLGENRALGRLVVKMDGAAD